MILTVLLTAGMLMQSRPDSLEAATVLADRGVVVSRTDTLLVQSTRDVSSTLLQLPGIYVGDYGGMAGLKSASLRGFGSAHTAIYLDGVRVGNIQSGQADLGFLSLPSLGAVVADYAQNSLSFVTARPVFYGRPVSGTARLQGGSFGTWQPYGRVNLRMGDKWSLSVHTGANITKGNFPLETGNLRTNNDLKQIQGGVDLFGSLRGGSLHAKIYYNNAQRGTPGSIDWPSTDRQQDQNLLAQAVFRKSFSPLYELQMSAKAASDRLYYQSEWGDSNYRQTEFQLNSAHRFHLGRHWTASLAADFILDGMNGNVYSGHRFQTVVAAGAAFRSERVKADAALEYSGSWNRNAPSWNSLSPSLDLRVKIVEGLDAVAFGRRAYRTPTFNELFYPGYGNAGLKPEDAWLTDLGLDFRRALGPAWTLKLRADGYYNWLSNKIISSPSPENPDMWLPYNVGKVQAGGADLLAGADFASGDWKAALDVRYGWQQALDKTPDTYNYNKQIPYVARHSVAVSGSASWKGLQLAVVYNLRAGRLDSYGEMPDWKSLDATLSKDFRFARDLVLGIFLSGRNLLNYRYDIVTGYPMPGISFLGGANFSF